MIVDTSAIVSLVLGEPASPAIAAALAESDGVRVSAATWLKAAVVLDSRRTATSRPLFDDVMTAIDSHIEPVTIEQMTVARTAYRDFGRGSGHPAKLNVGDCFSYALARTSGEPLLFTGDDFTHTDVVSVL